MTDLTRAPESSGGPLDPPIGKSRRAIRTARLHSVFVRYLRHFIIVGCSLAVLTLAIIIVFDPFKRLPHNVSASDVGLKGSVVTLETPKMKGFRQDGQPFELTGASGTQDILKPGIINLVGVDAKVGLDDATTAKVTSETGVYDSGQDIAWLHDNVRIKNNDSGYDIRLRSARIDFKSSEFVTAEPVIVLLNGGSTINADSMDISDNGHKISFEGEVKSVIDSGDANAADGNGVAEAAK